MGLWAAVSVPCPYGLFERVKGEAAALGGIIDGAEYGADIRLDVSLPGESVDALASRLTELSAGGIQIVRLGEEYRPGPRMEI